MYTEEILSEIRNRVNIVDVVSRYVTLKKVGRNYQGLCPFHSEKTPSFFVNPNLNIYKCFGCGTGGDIFKFLKDIEKISFSDAVEKLAKEAGIELPRDPRAKQEYQKRQKIKKVLDLFAGFYNKILFTTAGKQALLYLEKKRGLPLSFIKKFRLGYAPYDTDVVIKFANITKVETDLLIQAGLLTEEKTARFKNRVMFPLLDNTGSVIGFSGRTLSSSPNVPKYLNTPETAVFKKRFNLFGLFWAKKALVVQDLAILTEGQMDVLSSIKAGVPNIVAPLGTALTETQLVVLKRFTQKIAFAFDNDTAGEKALERGVILALKQGMIPYVIPIPQDFKDIDELIQKNPSDWIKLAQNPIEFFDYAFKRLKKAQQSNMHYTEFEPQINKIINIMVYAPKVRAQLLIKELAEILDIEQDILMEKLEKTRQQAEQYNRYELQAGDKIRQKVFVQQGKSINTTLKGQAGKLVANKEQSLRYKNSDSSLMFLYKQAYNLEEYITLLILHYPVLVLAKGFVEKYKSFILVPEFRAIARRVVSFVTSNINPLNSVYNNKSCDHYKVLMRFYNKFVGNLNDSFNNYIREKSADTKYYDAFLKLATIEPVFNSFDKALVYEFIRIWLKLQQIWLKIKISLVMDLLDKLEQEEDKKEDKVTSSRDQVPVSQEKDYKQNATKLNNRGVPENIHSTRSVERSLTSAGELTGEFLVKIKLPLSKLKQKQLEEALEKFTKQLVDVEQQLTNL